MSPRTKFVFTGANLMKLVLLTICGIAFFTICYSSLSAGTKWGFNCPGSCDSNHRQFSFRQFNKEESLSTKTLSESESKSNDTTISHVLFGIGGAEETWERRSNFCKLWWRPNVTRGYVWLDSEPAYWPFSSPPYQVSEGTARFKYTSWGSRSAIRIARIVKESFELGLEDVRWFVMGDDDTVFFPDNLVAVLNKYDHREMYYIGSNSECVEQDEVHSYTMGYGGAGFAISYPLAAELVRILDGCINRYHDLYGSDQKVGACIAELGIPLTHEPGFHQVRIITERATHWQNQHFCGMVLFSLLSVIFSDLILNFEALALR